jgi:hypothetical protein
MGSTYCAKRGRYRPINFPRTRCRATVADGMRNQEVELRLNLSEHTVRNYLIRIFDKLRISSRVELVLYAFSNTDGSSASDAARYSASA